LINGRFSIIGSLTELKTKFGEYSIVVRENEGGLNHLQLEEIIKSALPAAKKSENTEGKGVVFKVESHKQKL